MKSTAEAIGLIVLRIFSGLGEGVMYAALTDLLAAWVPLSERTTLGSFAYGGSTVNSFLNFYLVYHFPFGCTYRRLGHASDCCVSRDVNPFSSGSECLDGIGIHHRSVLSIICRIVFTFAVVCISFVCLWGWVGGGGTTWDQKWHVALCMDVRDDWVMALDQKLQIKSSDKVSMRAKKKDVTFVTVLHASFYRFAYASIHVYIGILYRYMVHGTYEAPPVKVKVTSLALFELFQFCSRSTALDVDACLSFSHHFSPLVHSIAHSFLFHSIHTIPIPHSLVTSEVSLH